MVQALTAGTMLSISPGEALAADRLAAPTSDSALFDLALLAPRLISVEAEGDGTASPAIDVPPPVADVAPLAGASPVGIPTQETAAAAPSPRISGSLPIAAGLLPPSNPADDAALAQALSALAALEQAGRNTLSPRPSQASPLTNPLMAQSGLVLTLPKDFAVPAAGEWAPQDGAPRGVNPTELVSPDLAMSEIDKVPHTVPTFSFASIAPPDSKPLLTTAVREALPHDGAGALIDQPADHATAPARVEFNPVQTEPRQDAPHDSTRDGVILNQLLSQLDVTARDVTARDVAARDLTAREVNAPDLPVFELHDVELIVRDSTPQQAVKASAPFDSQQGIVASPSAIEDARRLEQAIKIGDLVNEPRPIILPNRPMPVAPPSPLTDPASSVSDHAVLVTMPNDVTQVDPTSFETTRILNARNLSDVTSINTVTSNDQVDAEGLLSFAPAINGMVTQQSGATKNNEPDAMRTEDQPAESKDIMDDAAMLLLMPHTKVVQAHALEKAESSDKNDDPLDQPDSFEKNSTASTDLSLPALTVMTGASSVMPQAPRSAIDHDDLTERGSGTGFANGTTAPVAGVTVTVEQTLKTHDDQKALEAQHAPEAVNFDLTHLKMRAERTPEIHDPASDPGLAEAIKTALAPLLTDDKTGQTKSTPLHIHVSAPHNGPAAPDARHNGHNPSSDNGASQQNGKGFSGSSPDSDRARHVSNLANAIEFETVASAQRDADTQNASTQETMVHSDTVIDALTTQNAIDTLTLRDVTSYSVDPDHAAQMLSNSTIGNATPSLAVFAPQALHEATSTPAPQATQTQATQESYARLDHPVLDLQRDRAFESQIIAALKAGRNDARVSLYPPQLGQVTINLALDGQKVKVSLKTSNREATAVLSAERNTLAFALDGEGFTLEDFDVADESSGQDKNNHHREHRVGVAPTSTSSSEFSIDITI